MRRPGVSRLHGQAQGARAAASHAAVDAAIERLALGDVRRLLIGKLSRGYRQRVAIAQALLGDPELLVLDEPTNGLDPRQIIEMRGHIRALAGEHTVLVTSHILGEIERVADRVAVLLAGRLLGVHSLGRGAWASGSGCGAWQPGGGACLSARFRVSDTRASTAERLPGAISRPTSSMRNRPSPSRRRSPPPSWPPASGFST